jgi:hypothetical protein
MYLREYPEEGTRIRSEAQRTASYFTWEEAADNLISKLENQARLQKALSRRPSLPPPEIKESVELKLFKVANRSN